MRLISQEELRQARRSSFHTAVSLLEQDLVQLEELSAGDLLVKKPSLEFPSETQLTDRLLYPRDVSEDINWESTKKNRNPSLKSQVVKLESLDDDEEEDSGKKSVLSTGFRKVDPAPADVDFFSSPLGGAKAWSPEGQSRKGSIFRRINSE